MISESKVFQQYQKQESYIFNIFLNIHFIIYLKERDHKQEGQTEGERERESQADLALSADCDMGLDLGNLSQDLSWNKQLKT